MKTNPTSQSVIKDLKDYFETRYKLLKYEAIDKGSSMIADIITDIILIVIYMLAVVFFSITIALCLGRLLGSVWMGFGCITVVYLVISLFHRLFKTAIENALIRSLAAKLFKHKNKAPAPQGN